MLVVCMISMGMDSRKNVSSRLMICNIILVVKNLWILIWFENQINSVIKHKLKRQGSE